MKNILNTLAFILVLIGLVLAVMMLGSLPLLFSVGALVLACIGWWLSKKHRAKMSMMLVGSSLALTIGILLKLALVEPEVAVEQKTEEEITQELQEEQKELEELPDEIDSGAVELEELQEIEQGTDNQGDR